MVVPAIPSSLVVMVTARPEVNWLTVGGEYRPHVATHFQHIYNTFSIDSPSYSFK